MTFADRVAALAPLGFGPRQTAFLATVALHGGYCLQRQFQAAAGVPHGQVTRNFFATLVSRHLATAIQFQSSTGVIYHLHAKSLYRAIDQDDNRNRRVVSPALIARKLMVLDYVLTVSPACWFATEDDKLALFSTQLGLDRSLLPQRTYPAQDARRPATTRYFVHKLPIRLVPGEGVVEFVYLVVEQSGRPFEDWVRDHMRLLSRLPQWRIVLVCPPQVSHGARACEAGYVHAFGASPAAGSDRPRAELSWYFATRRAVEASDLKNLSVADLDRYRDLRRQLSSAAVERLYVAWQQSGDAALAPANAASPFAQASDVRDRLRTHVLPWRYRQFGSLPGVI